MLDHSAQKYSMLPGYLVTAPNLVGHGSRMSTDYRLSSIANDLRPYLAARNYSLIIGHSVGALATLGLFSHLPPSHPTAIILIDPPMQATPEKIQFQDHLFSDSCVNIKQAEAYSVENPLWQREDAIFRELGTRLCAVDALHGIFEVRMVVVWMGSVLIWLPPSKTNRGTFLIISMRLQGNGE